MKLSPRARVWRELLAMTTLFALGQAGHAAAAGELWIEVDRESFTLSSRDLRDGSSGPTFAVVLGSPGHPTPAGDFPIYGVVHNPKWEPGPAARSTGAKQTGPSPDGPMGVAKLPFAAGGYALHGGAHPLLLGKPISLGCIRARDQDLEGLLAWLVERGALREPPTATPPARADREFHQTLRLPLRLRIR